GLFVLGETVCRRLNRSYQSLTGLDSSFGLSDLKTSACSSSFWASNIRWACCGDICPAFICCASPSGFPPFSSFLSADLACCCFCFSCSRFLACSCCFFCSSCFLSCSDF